MDRSGADRCVRGTASAAAHDGARHRGRGRDRGVAHRGGRQDATGSREAWPAAGAALLPRAGWQAHLEDLGRSLAGDTSAHPERWTELTPAPAWRERWTELTMEPGTE